MPKNWFLEVFEPVPRDGDEPEEEDPGEGHEREGELELCGVDLEPGAGIPGDVGHGGVEDQHADAEDHREEHAGDGAGDRRGGAALGLDRADLRAQ